MFGVPTLKSLRSGSTDHTALLGKNDGTSGGLPHKLASWRVTALAGIGIACAVLITNVGVLAWAFHSHSPQDGLSTIYFGSCQTSKTITIWVDLAVNILSTMLLAASNNCAQILSSPTRDDIDSVHASSNRHWMDVGVPSMRNLRFIPIWRTCLWTLLFASSVPLHLMYNSVVFATRTTHEYTAFAVTEDFLQNPATNSSSWLDEPQALQITNMSKSLTGLRNLSNSDCLQTYGETQFLTSWKNVLIVVDGTLPDGQVVANFFEGTWAANFTPPTWPCSAASQILGPLMSMDQPGTPAINSWMDGMTGHFSGCNVQYLVRQQSTWRLPLADHYNLDNLSTTTVPGVRYCLAAHIEGDCAVKINTTILVSVVVCNVIKLGSLCATTLARDFKPLVTIGDAIESFLSAPDTRTIRTAPISIADIRQGRLPSPKYIDHKRASVASRTRWAFCITICLALLVLTFALLIAGTGKEQVFNFGEFDPKNVVPFSLSLPVIANVVLANTPQVLVSFAYLFYNSILTCMVMTDEYASFGSIRKALRVSQPRIKQRSTFWLQIPYKYSIPMLSSAALLHWLIARSLFFVELDVVGANGLTQVGSGITGCAFSPGAALAASALWGLLIILLLQYARHRFHSFIPVAGSCSLAISAACHCPETDTVAALLPVQYGVFVEDDENGVAQEKAGFSSEDVTPLRRRLPYYRYEHSVRTYDDLAEDIYAMQDLSDTTRLQTINNTPVITRKGENPVWRSFKSVVKLVIPI